MTPKPPSFEQMLGTCSLRKRLKISMQLITQIPLLSPAECDHSYFREQLITICISIHTPSRKSSVLNKIKRYFDHHHA